MEKTTTIAEQPEHNKEVSPAQPAQSSGVSTQSQKASPQTRTRRMGVISAGITAETDSRKEHKDLTAAQDVIKQRERRHSITHTTRHTSQHFNSSDTENKPDSTKKVTRLPLDPTEKIFLKEIIIKHLLLLPEEPTLKAQWSRRVNDAWNELSKITQSGTSEYNKIYIFDEEKPDKVKIDSFLEKIEFLLLCSIKFYQAGDGLSGEAGDSAHGGLQQKFEEIRSVFLKYNIALFEDKNKKE